MFQLGKSVFVTSFMCYVVLYYLSSVVGLRAQSTEPGEDGEDKESQLYNSDNWLDPGDMLATDLSSFTVVNRKDQHQQQTVEKDVKNQILKQVKGARPVEGVFNQQKNCDLPHFKQLARIIIESFPVPGKRYATIEVSNDDLKILQEFKEIDKEGERISDVVDLVVGIFTSIQEEQRLEQTFFSRIMSKVEYNKEIFVLIFIISVLIFILLIFETRTTISWYRQCWYVFGLLFMISIPWEWFRLYRKEYAEKQAELIKEIPPHCAPRNMTITARMSLWMAGVLTWSEDKCIKFQEAILVDPMWEVSPSLALSTTATRLLFEPLEYMADSCGKSLQAFFQHIPLVWQPVMIIIMTVMLLVCILLLTRSRIKFGFFEIGPGVTRARRLEGEDIDALRNCIRQEIGDVIGRRKEVAPVRDGNLEELPRIRAAVQEERADGYIPRGVRETESPAYDLPIKQNPVT